MAYDKIVEYIQQNFTISGEAGRLISNIINWTQNIADRDERFIILHELLDGTIGLTEEEIRMFAFLLGYQEG